MLFQRLQLFAAFLLAFHLALAAQIPERVQSPEELEARRLVYAIGRSWRIPQSDYVAALNDGDPDLRWAGMAGLLDRARQPTRERFDAKSLRSVARSDEPRVREYGIWLLGRYARFPDSASMALLSEYAQSSDERVRWRAIQALGAIGPPAIGARDLLMEALSDESLYVRAHAVEALGLIGADDSETVARLAALHREGEWAVRNTAGAALSTLGSAAAPAAIKDLAAGGRRASRAAGVLNRMGPEAGSSIAELGRSLETLDGSAARSVAGALGRIGPDAMPEIRRLIESSAQNRRKTARALQVSAYQGENEEAFQLLLQLLEDPAAEVRAAAAKALDLRVRRPEVPQALLRLAGDDADPGVRAAALETLPAGHDVSEQMIAAWGAGLRDSDERVRYAALHSMWLEHEGAEGYWPDVVALLEDDSQRVRYSAGLVLERHGQVARDAAPTVLDIMRRSKDSLRQRELLEFVAAYMPNDTRKFDFFSGLLRHEDYVVSYEAQRALVPYGQQALPVFRNAITSEAWIPGLKGAGALQADARSLLPEIVALTRHPHPFRRSEALRALVSIAPQAPEVHERLIALASDPEVSVRRMAFENLHWLPDREHGAATALQAIRNDPDGGVRSAAIRSLVKMRPTSDTVLSNLLEAVVLEPSALDSARRTELVRAIGEISEPSEEILRALIRAADMDANAAGSVVRLIRVGWDRPDLVPVRLFALRYEIRMDCVENWICCAVRVRLSPEE